MGALEEAHLATVAACVCDDKEEEDLLVELGGGKAPGDTMELTVCALLVGIGDVDRREGLRRTPKSVARHCCTVNGCCRYVLRLLFSSLPTAASSARAGALIRVR